MWSTGGGESAAEKNNTMPLPGRGGDYGKGVVLVYFGLLRDDRSVYDFGNPRSVAVGTNRMDAHVLWDSNHRDGVNPGDADCGLRCGRNHPPAC